MVALRGGEVLPFVAASLLDATARLHCQGQEVIWVKSGVSARHLHQLRVTDTGPSEPAAVRTVITTSQILKQHAAAGGLSR